MPSDKSLFTPTLARLFTEQGHWSQAAQIYRHLLETTPHRPEYLTALEEIEAHLAAQVPQPDQALIKLIATWVDMEMSYARLKQLKALRLNRRSPHEETDNHVDVDIA